jgi:hypothetical protein
MTKNDAALPQNQTLHAEPMVDARVAAVSLRLPHYWFADPAMRDRYRIPHYLLGGLVRYRMSELYAWAATHTTASRQASGQFEGDNDRKGRTA